MTEPIDVLEALLFASDTPVELTTIREVLELHSPDAARDLVDTLGARLRTEERALQVIEVGGGFRLVTRPEVAPWLVKLARARTRQRLSAPALASLAHNRHPHRRGAPAPAAVAPRARDARHHRVPAAGVAARGRRGAGGELRGRARQSPGAP